MVVLLSHASNESQYVKRKYLTAAAHKAMYSEYNIIPIALDEIVTISHELQCLDYINATNRTIDLELVKELLL